MLNGNPDSFSQKLRTRIWEVSEVPRNWREEDVVSLLQDANWTEVQVITRRRPVNKRARITCILQGHSPPQEAGPFV